MWPEDAITSRNSLTYKDAGVDIDAWNAFVEAIGPLAKATARPGSAAGLGGFGAFFDLKAAGYEDPVLVAATDGVGTKLKVAITAGRHDTVGIDLVAMCVNDLVVQGAEPYHEPMRTFSVRGSERAFRLISSVSGAIPTTTVVPPGPVAS